MALYVCGHKIPDSDSIISAIAMAYLKNELGTQSVAVRQGDVNPESQFILDKFDLQTPELKTSFAGDEIYLVDFSDKAQAPEDIEEATVVGIADHHKLGDITTSAPLECWIRPVGCSATVIKEMFDYHKVEIPKNLAGAMMCAILSDTVIFKSPTCTQLDIQIVKELAQIAGIEDFGALGMEMFRVKSAVEGTSMRDLVMRDFKDFDMHGTKVGIGQLEVVDLSIFDNIKSDLMSEINKVKEEGGRHTVLLLLTDIMKEGSEVLVASDDESIVEKAFEQKLDASAMWLDGCLSRKKQIVPFLEPMFA